MKIRLWRNETIVVRLAGRNNSHVHPTEQDRKRWKETSLGPAEEPRKTKKKVSGQFLFLYDGKRYE